MGKLNNVYIKESISGLPVLDLYYPVGTNYCTNSETFDPNIQWPGSEWEKTAIGRVIIGADYGNTGIAGANHTGGIKEVTLTINQIPKHTHDQYVSTGKTAGAPSIRCDYSGDGNYNTYYQCRSGATGGGEPHNNLQPYVCKYYWRRIK